MNEGEWLVDALLTILGVLGGVALFLLFWLVMLP